MHFAKRRAKELDCKKISLGMVYGNIPSRNWYQECDFIAVDLIKFEKVCYTVGIMELAL